MIICIALVFFMIDLHFGKHNKLKWVLGIYSSK